MIRQGFAGDRLISFASTLMFPPMPEPPEQEPIRQDSAAGFSDSTQPGNGKPSPRCFQGKIHLSGDGFREPAKSFYGGPIGHAD